MALADALEREGRLVEAIDALALANRLRRDAATERRLLRLRCAAYAQLDHSLAPATWPHFALDPDAPPADGPLEVPAAALTPGVVRDGILRHGHLLVRGLVPPARVARLRQCIDEAFRADEVVAQSGPTSETAPWCDPFEGIPDAGTHRLMVRASHGILAADAPRALYEYLETLQDLGLRSLGLTADEARRVNQELGMAIFFAIPPTFLTRAEAVAVNGAPALLFSQSSVEPAHRLLIWRAGGMQFGLMGSLPPEELLQVAGSLQ